jgi:hypothetical protein
MRTSLLVLLGSALYATARYNVFKGVPWKDWPAYTLNKALALSALLLLVLAAVRKARASDGRILAMASALGFVHVLLSLVLLSPDYYEKLFASGRLTAAAGLSMTLGAAAAVAMAVGKGRRTDPDAAGGLSSLAILAFVVGLHAALQGFPGWFTPSAWPGAMPPITLISFVLGVAAVASVVRPRRSA